MAVDENWDVILIGAGQNNFALGTYLGMAGLETVICESRLENGGRLFSEEITLPGYWHNSLAYFQDNREVSPVWRELDWENGHHAEFVTPPVISSLLLPGGASVSHHQDLDGTLASLAHHSAADRAAWKDAHQRFRGIVRDILIPSYYAPPEAPGALEERIAADPAGNDFLRLARMSAAEAAEDLFESEAVRTLVLSQMAIPRGWAPDYEGGGREVLALIAGDERPQLARGGSHSIAQVLQRAYVMHGGQIRALHHVDRILVEDGRAVGVRLRDGREWKARRAVVSNVDPHGTFIDMVGEEHLDGGFAQAVRAIEPDEFSYFQVHLALKAPLRFAVHEAADSFVGRAMNVNYGPGSVEDLKAMWREIRAGEFPEHPCLHVTCPTWFDALQAPPAKHTASGLHARPLPAQGSSARGLGEPQERLHGAGAVGAARRRHQPHGRQHRDEGAHGPVLPGRPVAEHAPGLGVGGPEDPGPDGRQPPHPATGALPHAHPGPLPGGRGHAPGGRGHRRFRARRLERHAAGPGPGKLKHEGG